MKIIDAVWEKRNLGVSCHEIIFDDKDTLTDIEQNWDKITDREYLVFKVPPTRPDIVELLQSKNFRFIETAMTLYCDLNDWSLPEKFEMLCKESSHEPMNQNDIEKMFAEIRKGIFKTDRVYLDSCFSHEQAIQRYVNWAKDMIERGVIPYKVLYQNEVIGFICGDLSGVYSSYEKTGSGLFFQYAVIKLFIAAKAPIATVNCSSNNPSVVKLYCELGFKIKKMLYVFVKHN